MRHVLLVVVALIVAGLGAFPVMSLLAAEPDTAKDGSLEQVTAEAPTTTIVEAVVVAPPETTPVGDLTGSVSKVLELRGSAQDLGVDELDNTLPDAVARLLIDRDAVLVVAEPVTP
jgi:hypothetical protein